MSQEHSAHSKDVRMIDLELAKGVEVHQDETGKLWVNVDGRCLLRIGKIELPLLVIRPRHKKTKQIDDLKKALAGFMAANAILGGHMEEEQMAWIKTMLKGEQRTPIQLWREVAKLPS